MKKLITGIVCIMLLVGCSQDITTSKTMYTFDSKDISADAYYEKLHGLYGDAFLYQMLENQVVETLELSEEDKKSAQTQYDALMKQYTDDQSKTYLDSLIKSYGYKGYDDVLVYLQNSYRKQSYIDSVIQDSYKDEAFKTALTPKMVKHVVVMTEKDGELSAEAKLKTQAIDDALATAKPEDFEETVSKIVDGTSVIFEDLGYTDKNTSFETPFLEAALKLNAGEISGWVQTSYGYHRIYVYGDDFGALSGDGFYDAVLNYDAHVENKAMWDLFKTKNVEFSDAFKKVVMKHLGIEGE